VAHFIVTSVRPTDTGLVFADSLPLSHSRLAMRTAFKPIQVKQSTGEDVWAVDPAKGIYAEIDAPEAGTIGSIAVQLQGAAATGKMFLSTVDPQKSYDGFFLYTFIEDVLPATSGPSMFRKTEIHSGGYSTITLTDGKLYLLILDGPKITQPDGLIPANVAVFADTI
jgi:hypothetical protein